MGEKEVDGRREDKFKGLEETLHKFNIPAHLAPCFSRGREGFEVDPHFRNFKIAGQRIGIFRPMKGRCVES